MIMHRGVQAFVNAVKHGWSGVPCSKMREIAGRCQAWVDNVKPEMPWECAPRLSSERRE